MSKPIECPNTTRLSQTLKFYIRIYHYVSRLNGPEKETGIWMCKNHKILI